MNDCVPSWIVLVALTTGVCIGIIIGVVLMVVTDTAPADDDNDYVEGEDDDEES